MASWSKPFSGACGIEILAIEGGEHCPIDQKNRLHIPPHVLLFLSATFLICFANASRTSESFAWPGLNDPVYASDLILTHELLVELLKMKPFQRMIQGALLSFCVVRIDAFWRMVCGTIQTGRIDPIVNPGMLSGHCHTVAGPLSRSNWC